MTTGRIVEWRAEEGGVWTREPIERPHGVTYASGEVLYFLPDGTRLSGGTRTLNPAASPPGPDTRSLSGRG